MEQKKRGRGRPPKKSENDVFNRERIHYEKLADGIYSITYKDTLTKLKYTKEQVLKFLEQNNEPKLREMSEYFFMVSGQYRRLASYYANLLTYDFLVVPKQFKQGAFTKPSFLRDFQSVLQYTDDSHVEETCRFIALIAILDGVFYGYERTMNGIASIQQLPPDFCRSKYKINGNYAVEFNLKFFDLYKDVDQKLELFEMFPPEFLELYLDHKENKSKEWVQLNPEFARCHKFTDNPNPLLCSMFPEIINLKEYKEMDKTQTKMDLYKLIVQKLPVDKDTGLPQMQLEEGRALHQNTKKMITQEGIDVITSPLDIDSISLQERGQTLRDNIERANNGIYDTIGSSKMLFSSGKDGGSVGLSHSIKTDEALMFPLLNQFERWYSTKFKYLLNNKNYYFKMMMPKLTIFNWKEKYDVFKEAATLGFPKLLPLTAMGIKQSDFMDLMEYENDILGLHEKMIPLRSSHTLSDSEGAGAPTKPDGDLSPSGEKTRITDANNNRNN